METSNNNENKKINITAQMLDGKTYPLSLAPTQTIKDLKLQVFEHTDVTIDKLRTVYEGKHIEDNSLTLAECKIEDGKTVHIVLKIGTRVWAANFKIKDLRTGELSEKYYIVDQNQTFDELFEEVAKDYGLDKDAITLKAGETVYKLEDKKGEGIQLPGSFKVVELGV